MVLGAVISSVGLFVTVMIFALTQFLSARARRYNELAEIFGDHLVAVAACEHVGRRLQNATTADPAVTTRYWEANREQTRSHSRLRILGSKSTVEASDEVGFALTVVGSCLARSGSTFSNELLRAALQVLSQRAHELLEAMREQLGRQRLGAYDPTHTKHGTERVQVEVAALIGQDGLTPTEVRRLFRP